MASTAYIVIQISSAYPMAPKSALAMAKASSTSSGPLRNSGHSLCPIVRKFSILRTLPS